MYHVTGKMADGEKSLTEIEIDENTTKSGLKCFVSKFSEANILKNAHLIEQTLSSRCLCFQKKDGSIEFVHLDRSGDHGHGVLTDVTR